MAICHKCRSHKNPEMFQDACIYSDIESSKGDINPAECMQKLLLATNEKDSSINEKGSSINEKDSSINEKDQSKIENSSQKYRKSAIHPSFHPSRSSMYSKTDGKPTDELDEKIGQLILEGHHERAISRILGCHRPTIQYRIKKLLRLGLIEPEGKRGVRSYPKFYAITQRWMNTLVYDERGNEERKQQATFSAHSISFKFPILEGKQPKSEKAVKMHNWTAYDFEFLNHTIRSTTRSILVFVNLDSDLGADLIDHLDHKFEEFAKKFALEFSQQYGIKLGQPRKYKRTHYLKKDDPLAQKTTEHGEFHTKSGIHLDRSRSSGDLEIHNEEFARAWEKLDGKMVQVRIYAKVEKIDKKIDEIDEKLEQMRNHGNKSIHNSMEDQGGMYA